MIGSTMNASNSTNGTSTVTVKGSTSTLLIPEGVVWLPYAGLVFTVIVWLGYDFYRFHQKNKQKYVRIEEHMTIIRAVPTRQRISMVSGIGLRFRRGKPVLGEVWNTSPSSSDLSSCYSPIHHGRVAYSREVTPSDEGGGSYSEGETVLRRDSRSFVGYVSDGDGSGDVKGWEIGGEPIAGQIPHNDNRIADESQESSGFVVDARNKRNSSPDQSQSWSPANSVKDAALAPRSASKTAGQNHRPVNGPTAGAGGGVDDGGGGGDTATATTGKDTVHNEDTKEQNQTKLYKNAYTQTSFDEIHMMDMRSGYHTPRRLHIPSSPRIVNVSPRQHRYSIAGDLGLQHPSTAPADRPDSPFVIDFSPNRSPYLNRDRTFSETGSDLSIQKHSSRSDKRLPALRLDLLAGSYSPTAEIVATKHGFVVEGVEVPHFPGTSPRPIPTVGSDIFKQPETHNKVQPFIKPLTPSPAVTARIPSPHLSSPRISSIHQEPPHWPTLHQIESQQQIQPQDQRHPHQRRKPEHINISGTKRSPSKKSTLAKPRAVRAASSSPRMIKEMDKSDDPPKFKYSDESTGEPQTAPIPSHLYHQDEEGYFSSIHSANSRSKGLVHRDGSDSSKKGILFFSRLSGAGRHHEANASTSSTGNSGAAYKTGGFES